MPDPIAELLRQNAALYDQFVAENTELEGAFLSRRPSAVAETLRAIGRKARIELGIEPDAVTETPTAGVPASAGAPSDAPRPAEDEPTEPPTGTST